MTCRHCGKPIIPVALTGITTWVHPERANSGNVGTRECASMNFVKKEGRSILVFASPADRTSWIETWETAS